MRMSVDQAGDHIFPFGIDHAGTADLGTIRLKDICNAGAVYSYIAFLLYSGGRVPHRSVFNQYIIAGGIKSHSTFLLYASPST